MSTALIPFGELQAMGSALARSGLFGMKTPDQAIALMLVAQAEGQHPATIAQDYDIIQGKATRKTHSVLARFQKAGGKVEWHQLTDKIADATFSHPQGGSVRLDWTIEMAKQAKLAGKDNWVGYSRAMLRARLIAEGVRATYPAALGGMMISEEAQDLGPADAQPSGQSPAAAPPVKHMGNVEEVKPALPALDDEKFGELLPQWREAIRLGKAGKGGADAVIAKAKTKYSFTAEQEAAIRAPIEQPETEQKEPMTYETVADSLTAAFTPDELAAAAALIDRAPEERRDELRTMHAELKEGMAA